MSAPEPSMAQICPFLGIPDDPGSHFSFPEPAHRCHAGATPGKPPGIELGFQAGHCLGGGYAACSRFQAATAPIPAWHPAAGTVRTVRTVKSPDRRAVLLVVGLLVFAVAASLIALSVLTGREPNDDGVPAGAASPPSLAPTPALLPTAMASPGPTGQATPEPVSTPTPAPTPTRTPAATQAPDATPLVHVVQAGETLTSIAAQYDQLWPALAEVNNLQDPDLILVGQELIIPTADP